MRSTLVALLLILVSIGAAPAQDLKLTNAQIVNPADRTITRGAIIIRNGVITEIVTDPTADFAGNVVDLNGKWVIPGLNDMHVHSYGNVAPGNQMQLMGTAEVARIMLYCGVTGFLDLFSPEDQIIELRDRQRKEGLLGADIYCAGALLTAPGGHGTEYGIPARVMRNPQEAAKMVDELAARKADVVKIVYDHAFPETPTIDRPTMESAVQAAKRHGIKTVIHIGTWDDAYEAVRAGADCITHIYFRAEIPDSVAALMKERGAYEIPTLAVENDFLNTIREPALLKRPLLADVASLAIIDAYADSSKLDRRMKGWLELERNGESYIFNSVAKLRAAGVTLLAGTDVGNPGTFQGYSLHRELELLVKAGLTPWEALAAATTKAGEFLGRDFGIRPGAVANLVVLDGSPVEDIVNTQKIASVIYHGAVVNREELLHPKSAIWTKTLLDDFSRTDRMSASGGLWSYDVDTAWGGASTLKVERKGGMLHVSGKLGPKKGMPGMAGVTLTMAAGGGIQDVNGFDGVRLRIKATKGPLMVKLLTTAIKNFDFHAALIENKPGFQQIDIPFTEFRQLWSAPVPWTGKDLQGIMILASDFSASSYDFTIDSIEFYSAKK